VRHLLKWSLRIVALVAIAAAVALIAFRWQAERREALAGERAAPPSGRFVKAAGLDVFVQEAGPADGPAVLFVHGTGAWSEAWRAQMSLLARGGARAVALDLPPFGFSQRPEPASYGKKEQGRRIVGVLDALGITRAVLVGHSFGGGPTVEAALLAPERVRALVLVDAALGIAPPEEQAPEPPLALRVFLAARPLRDAVVATFLTNPSFTRRLLRGFIDDPARATDEWVQVYQRPLGVGGTTGAVGAWLPELLAPRERSASENPASYRALTTPLFLIWGERDTITPLAQGQALARLVPGAELEVMKEVGHIPQIENAERFNEVLAGVIAKSNARP